MTTHHWRLPAPLPGYPNTVAYRGSHMGAAWDDNGSIYACFYPDGRQTYRGDVAARYVLERGRGRG